MASRKLHLRTRLVRLLAVAVVLVAEGALAQEAAPEAAAEAPAEILAIPVENVSERAESLSAELQAMLPSEASQERQRAVDAELEGLKADIASRVASANAALAGDPSAARLRDLEQQLVGLRKRLAAPDQKLGNDLAKLSDALARLNASAEIWKKTAEEARGAGTSKPTLQRIASMRNEIDRVRDRVASRRNEILAQRDEFVDPTKLLDRTLAEVGEAITDRVGRLFSLDRPPIWSPKVREALLGELNEGWTEPLAERLERLEGYVGERRQLIGFQLALFVALVLGLRSLGARAKARADETYDLREAELVFTRPTAVALVIVLGLTPQLHPLAPNLFRLLAFTTVVLPAAVIVHRLAPRAMIPLVVGLPILYLTDRIRDIIETVPTLERMLFLAELVGAMLFLLWLLRPSRYAQIPAEMIRQPSFRVVGTAMRLAIGAFGLAIFAEVVGLGNLAGLVGNGSLRLAYAALFLYALLKVLQSLVAYALVLRPLRLLNFVSRNRRLVRRRLDRGLQLVIGLAWVYLALSTFEIAAPARSALEGLLSASLSIGALSVSLGDLVVFAVTVWLSFRLAHFVNFVLHQDVFPRTQLPRGVPYAMSNLLRYVLIFIGFLVALAAAGIQLSNLTVIAGGLGVGIGFGLQSMVNNFVSGLILLFERPLSVGDVVQLHTQDLWGEIRRIGMRASVIHTWEGAEMIVPNGQLISESVTNWTLSDRRRRVEVDVGVQYGTDAERVIELLLEVARGNSNVLTAPEPVALFLGFGDSSLDFRLRTWIGDFDEGFTVRSQLAVAIQRALADAGISVPFPQRDLHVRSVSADAASQIGRGGPATARRSSDDEG